MFPQTETDSSLNLDTDRQFFTPGEEISGSFVLESSKVCKLIGLRATLLGVCKISHLENELESNSTRNLDLNPTALHGEVINFLQVSTDMSNKEDTYSSGVSRFNFSLAIPLNCTNEKDALRADWASTPLPCTFDGVSNNGSIRYVLKVTANIKGILASKVVERGITMASLESCNPVSNILQKKKILERELAAKVYDYPNETTSKWAQRLIGMDTSTASKKFMVRMMHSAVGLPSWDLPLKKVASLSVYKVDDDEDKKGIEYAVHDVRSRIVYTIVTTSSLGNQHHTSIINIHDTGKLAPKPLKFEETSSGKMVCDISEYLSPSSPEHSVTHAQLVTIRVPSLSVTATLQVDVGIVPMSGCPLRPRYARLESIVMFYHSRTNQLPPGVEMVSTDSYLCPPPAYEALEKVPEYEPCD